ncbi:MAG: DUF6542 domain-containing protein [Mycobacterium sp.]
MSGLRGRSAVAADHRSVLPRLPGIPWWGATILAATFAAVGFAYDAGTGNGALSYVFAGFYVVGCVLAVLAVRQSGLFTTVIQPPLILFIAVPFAYFVFHGSTFTGIKDTLINCGYPLIERFPLMFFTSAAVLLLGMVRWYLGTLAKRDIATDADADAEPSAIDLPEDGAAAEAVGAAAKTSPPRRSRRPATERPSRTTADEEPRARRSATGSSTRTGRASGAATGSSRSRHSLPPETEIIEPVPDRPRRRTTPPVDRAEPRRRPRADQPREGREPREPRVTREGREPRERRPLSPMDRRGTSDRSERPRRERAEPRERSNPSNPRERSTPRETYDRSERPTRSERTPRRPRSTDYEPYENHEPPPTSRTSSGGTHHPISRVRYRSTEDGDERTEHRTRPRRPRHSAPESWEA